MTPTDMNPAHWGTPWRPRNLTEAGVAHLQTWWAARKNRRSVAGLLYWNDHMLRDIGLTRADLHSALAARFFEDPSDTLVSLQRERRFDAGRRRRHPH